MKKALIILAAATMAAACTTQAPKVAGINYDYMDTSVAPGEDFVKYATGHWLEHNPQPKEYSRWGTVDKVADDNVKTLANLIKDIASKENKKGSIAQKIGDLYNMAMDSTRLNAEGAAPLKAHLAELDAITTREQLLERCAREHDNLLFGMYVSGERRSQQHRLHQPGRPVAPQQRLLPVRRPPERKRTRGHEGAHEEPLRAYRLHRGGCSRQDGPHLGA